MKPDLSSIPKAYRDEIRQIDEENLLEALIASDRSMQEFLGSVPENKAGYRYAEGKWSVKEVIGHLLDTERIMAYRALRFARNDRTPLPGFEQDDYALQANAAARTLANLAEEMARLRASTMDLFRSFTPEMLARKGEANQCEFSVSALGYIIAGHERHHLRILRERY